MFDKRGNDAPFVMDAHGQRVDSEPSTLFKLAQELENAMGAYKEVQRIVIEAQIAEQKSLEKIGAIQQQIDDWYSDKRHLASPVGSHWRPRANGNTPDVKNSIVKFF